MDVIKVVVDCIKLRKEKNGEEISERNVFS
jgi:hypothetical protein